MRSGKRYTRGFFFCQRLHPSIWNAFSYFIANNHILRLLNLTANIRPFCLPVEKTRHTKVISTHGIILFVSWELRSYVLGFWYQKRVLHWKKSRMECMVAHRPPWCHELFAQITTWLTFTTIQQLCAAMGCYNTPLQKYFSPTESETEIIKAECCHLIY